MPLVASQVIGLILLRYVLEVEPLASMPAEQVVATYAPTLQRYLTGPLPSTVPAADRIGLPTGPCVASIIATHG